MGVFSSSGVYTGYIIDDGEAYGYSKVQVWVPSLNGSYNIGSFKGVGENLGNDFGLQQLYELRNSERKFVVLCYK